MAGVFVTVLVAGSVVGGVVCLGLAAVSWNHREVPAALPFGALALGIGAWGLANAAFLLANSASGAYIADRVIRAASSQVPPLWVVFVLSFTGQDRWISWRTIALLWAVPLAYVFASVTAPVLGWANTPQDVLFLTVNGIGEYYVRPELAYELHLLVAYLLLLAGYVVLVSFLIRSRAVYRKQTWIILLGSLVPALVNGVAELGFTPHPGIDPTPLAFIVTGVLFGVSLAQYDFLRITPMAGDVLVDELPDPVFLLDDADRIVDCNPAATRAFGDPSPRRKSIDAVHPSLPADVADGDTVELSGTGAEAAGRSSFFECGVSRLEDQYGNEHNRLVVLRDVTGQYRRQQRLESLQASTRQFLAASTDETIAEIAVEYADDVLDTRGTAVFLADDGTDRLRPVATTDGVADVFEEREPPAEPIAATLWDAYESGVESITELPGTIGGDAERALVMPLGDHGVLWVGTRTDEALGPDDEGFATILARTTQVALTRVERESELRRSRSAVERRSEQIAFFNGVLRHTLRNALLVIQGRVEHLRETVPAEEEPHVDTVVNWCEDLATLSEEIKAVNDTVTATESERLAAVDLSGILRERCHAFAAEHPNAEFQLDVQDGLRVQANELATGVVGSVVENAVVHNDRPDPHVRIWTVRAADRVQVHVADDGPGMDHEMKSTVFERDLSTTQTASGFGLYFVSVLMNLYGGTVWFEDNDPRGTVAVLEFQVAKSAAADEETTTAPAED